MVVTGWTAPAERMQVARKSRARNSAELTQATWRLGIRKLANPRRPNWRRSQWLRSIWGRKGHCSAHRYFSQWTRPYSPARIRKRRTSPLFPVWTMSHLNPLQWIGTRQLMSRNTWEIQHSALRGLEETPRWPSCRPEWTCNRLPGNNEPSVAKFMRVSIVVHPQLPLPETVQVEWDRRACKLGKRTAWNYEQYEIFAPRSFPENVGFWPLRECYCLCSGCLREFYGAQVLYEIPAVYPLSSSPCFQGFPTQRVNSNRSVQKVKKSCREMRRNCGYGAL